MAEKLGLKVSSTYNKLWSTITKPQPEQVASSGGLQTLQDNQTIANGSESWNYNYSNSHHSQNAPDANEAS